MLPDLVRAAAEPVAAIDRMTVISTDGASAVTKTVANNVEQGLEIAASLTGLDLRQLFSQLASRAASGTVLAEDRGPRRPQLT